MNASTGPRLRILILAAGQSRRLGAPKALARIRGQSLVQRTLACVRGLGQGPVLLVVPPRCSALRIELRGARAQLLVNARRARGLSSSVRIGMRHARFATGVLILPVDLSHPLPRELRRLCSRWRGGPRRVVARRLGQHGVAPLILPKCRFDAAMRIEGDVGMRDYLASLADADRVLVDMPSAALDVDTPQDLRRARRSQPRGV